MDRKKIGAVQYLMELNQAYEKTENYNPNNRFRRRDGAALTNGIAMRFCTYTVWTNAHSLAIQKVSEEFEHDPET